MEGRKCLLAVEILERSLRVDLWIVFARSLRVGFGGLRAVRLGEGGGRLAEGRRAGEVDACELGVVCGALVVVIGVY